MKTTKVKYRVSFDLEFEGLDDEINDIDIESIKENLSVDCDVSFVTMTRGLITVAEIPEEGTQK